MRKMILAGICLALAGCVEEGDGYVDFSGEPAAVEVFQVDGMLSQESYASMNADNVAAGVPEVRGEVHDEGVLYTQPFEVTLMNLDTGELQRILFADNTGTFTLWPAPGGHEISIKLTNGKHCDPEGVTVEAGGQDHDIEFDTANDHHHTH